MNFVIVGNGGIGSNLVTPLVKFLSYHRGQDEKDLCNIIIVDGDTVEHKNLLRQDFFADDIGKNKAEITAAVANSLIDHLGTRKLAAEAIPKYLKEDNVADIIKEGDVVLVGVDNYVTRMVIEEHAEKLDNIFVVFGGNEYHDGDINIFLRKNGKNETAKYSDSHPEIKNRDKFPDEMSCEEAAKSSPQLIMTNLSVATFMLNAVWTYLTEQYSKAKMNMWNETLFDIRTGCVAVKRNEP